MSKTRKVKRVKSINYYPLLFIGMLCFIGIVTIISIENITIRFSILGYFIGGFSTFLLNGWISLNKANKDNENTIKNALMQMKCNKDLLDHLSVEGKHNYFVRLYVLDNSELKKLNLDWFDEDTTATLLRYINRVNWLRKDSNNNLDNYRKEINILYNETMEIIAKLEKM